MPVVRKSLGLFAAIFLLGAVCASAASSQRIVSLTPSVTEMLFAIGAGDQVVGVSQYCDYPPQVARLPRVGSFLTPNLEAIVALRPTLVIGIGLSSETREVRALREMGSDVMLVKDESVGEIEDGIRAIGDRIGRANEARALVASLDAQINRVREQIASMPRDRVLMLVGHEPLIGVGAGTFLDDLLTLANSDNLAASTGQQWPKLNAEFVIAMRPDIILDGQMGSDPASPARYWERYSSVPAVRNHRVYGYPQDPILHAGPRIGTSLHMLAAMIHPRAFAETRGAKDSLQ
jgi:iron complex transport system substrate-binding protein